jgi:hypothetical protein
MINNNNNNTANIIKWLSYPFMAVIMQRKLTILFGSVYENRAT